MAITEPQDIEGVTVDGQVVYYRPGEVIAIGEAARRFVQPSGREVGDLVRDGRESEDRPLISPLPTAYLFSGLDDPLAAVQEARARGLRVQLNHVFFAHSGCRCDPCCGANPYGAFPYKATPYKATPYKATPYKATAPTKTNAVVISNVDANRESELQRAEGQQSDVRVLIIDTGMSDGTVPTPLGHLIDGDKEDRPDGPPLDGDGLVDPVAGHGTFIAGIVEQLWPHCDIWISKVIGPAGNLSEWDVATEIHALLTKPFDRPIDLSRTILNLSFGGGLYSACNPLVGEAIAAAQEGGVVVVASAGNEASCRPVYPANFPGVVSVGAVDSEGEPAHFTNRGSWVKACALGVDIVSTFFDFAKAAIPPPLLPNFVGGWAIWSGTSFATPVVVAAIAKEISAGKPAVEARDAVLGRGTKVPCLGVRVDDGDFSSASLQAPEN